MADLKITPQKNLPERDPGFITIGAATYPSLLAFIAGDSIPCEENEPMMIIGHYTEDGQHIILDLGPSEETITEGHALDIEMQTGETWAMSFSVSGPNLDNTEANAAFPALPGSICETCFDAPATALSPAPWGGEMGVCSACAEPEKLEKQ